MKPKFKITNNMLSDLTSIHASREIILSAHILPKFKRRLKEDAIIINRTHSSTAIEGNPLDRDDVKDLFHGIDVTAREKDKLEVQNYLEVLKYLDKVNKISEKVILKIHELTCKGILPKEECGSYGSSLN